MRLYEPVCRDGTGPNSASGPGPGPDPSKKAGPTGSGPGSGPDPSRTRPGPVSFVVGSFGSWTGPPLAPLPFLLLFHSGQLYNIKNIKNTLRAIRVTRNV